MVTRTLHVFYWGDRSPLKNHTCRGMSLVHNYSNTTNVDMYTYN